MSFSRKHVLFRAYCLLIWLALLRLSTQGRFPSECFVVVVVVVVAVVVVVVDDDDDVVVVVVFVVFIILSYTLLSQTNSHKLQLIF